jgi:hypothetical protein
MNAPISWRLGQSCDVSPITGAVRRHASPGHLGRRRRYRQRLLVRPWALQSSTWSSKRCGARLAASCQFLPGSAHQGMPCPLAPKSTGVVSIWCPLRESDSRPPPYQGGALPLSQKGDLFSSIRRVFSLSEYSRTPPRLRGCRLTNRESQQPSRHGSSRTT